VSSPALPAALRATLARVGAEMVDAAEPWWVITGAAVALHGAATMVADVDVLIGAGDAVTLFERLGLPPQPGAPSDRYRSGRDRAWRRR